ncbi:V-type ATP synthase subunit D [Methanoculleus sp. DTU007]|uniref:V-type ATP synthase subunit D n=1 Tax=Methanoculleus sp. DTU007 TaxID=1671626 RepID=UPI000B12CA0D
MPPDKIQPTRSGLLIVRRQLALAKRIHRLLSMKLDGMMLELTKLAEQAALHRRVLEKRYTGAREMAAVATMMEGGNRSAPCSSLG